MSDERDAVSTVDIAEVAERAARVAEAQRAGTPVDDRPSILFCCPGCVLDVSNGAALSLRTILAGLAARGFRAVALQAAIFDSPLGGQHVLEAGKLQKDKPIWRTFIDDVEHLIVQTGSTQRRFMTCQEEETYMNLFRGELQHRRPSFILLWGGLILERTIMREARDAGVPVVFYLVNPGYRDRTVFRDVSVIVTDTEATARLYKQRHGFDCTVLGKFVDVAQTVSPPPRRPEAITFINPSFEKGVSVFMPLAKLAARECPEIRFLVVQSRGRWNEALEVLKFRPEDFPNVKVLGHQFDMRPTYAATRALLVPSLWHESGARVIAEAQLNGIPVIASDTGGSAELIGSAGRVFALPEEVREKKTEVVVTEATLRLWLDEIRRIWNDEKYYQFLCREAELEAGKYSMDRSIEKLVAAVAAVAAAQAEHPAGPASAA